MEFLSVALLFVIIYLLLSGKNYFSGKIAVLELQIHELQRLLKQSTIKAADIKTEVTTQQPEKAKEPEIPKPQPRPAEPVAEKQPDVITAPATPAPKPAPRAPIPPPPVYRKREKQPSFFERHPDLEKFIGENLINKIGIAILVLAIGFFVKYAIDNNWVGPVGRVAIGIVCGGILIGIAHRLRNSYKAFSSVLVGGGLAIMYFTITLAYHQFHLFNQLTSLIILIVITCFAVALALLYDKQELAVIALVGGLGSPFMVSSGQANYTGLFTYIIILNTGLLVIAYNKAWRVLNASAFGLTVIIFSLVLTTLTTTTYLTGFIYASVLYLLFFGINVANNIRENKKFIASDFSILLINTALYFAVGLYLLTEMQQQSMRGVFSICLAVINLLLSFILFKNRKVDTNILYLLIGITLTFISLTAPIQLNGHYITMFWAAEAVLLYWLYLKSNIQLMKLSAVAIWGAMIISLLMDWAELYGSWALTLNIIANKGFITTLVSAISTYLLYIQVNKDSDKQIYGITIPTDVYRYTAFVLVFLSGLLEINHQFMNRFQGTELNILYILLYVTVFIYVFQFLAARIASIKLHWLVNTVIISVCAIMYLLLLPAVFDVEYTTLSTQKLSATHFLAHGIGAIFMALLLYKLALLIKQHLTDGVKPIATWLLAAVTVIFLSLEVCIAITLITYSPATTIGHIETVYIKVGLPILWSLSSFAFMIVGMKVKARTLRVISLTLFSITLLKLFIFDIRNIPPAGKIAAFFCLGVILLIVSFMYQRVKKILVEDNNIKTDE